MNSPEGPEVGGDELVAFASTGRTQDENQPTFDPMTEGLTEERLTELEAWAGLAELDYHERWLLEHARDMLDLIAEVRRLRAQPCPHVVTGDEGTAYCDLAESSVRELRERVAAFEAVYPYYSDGLSDNSVCIHCQSIRGDEHFPQCPWGGDGQ